MIFTVSRHPRLQPRLFVRAHCRRRNMSIRHLHHAVDCPFRWNKSLVGRYVEPNDWITKDVLHFPETVYNISLKVNIKNKERSDWTTAASHTTSRVDLIYNPPASFCRQKILNILLTLPVLWLTDKIEKRPGTDMDGRFTIDRRRDVIKGKWPSLCLAFTPSPCSKSAASPKN